MGTPKRESEAKKTRTVVVVATISYGVKETHRFGFIDRTNNKLIPIGQRRKDGLTRSLKSVHNRYNRKGRGGVIREPASKDPCDPDRQQTFKKLQKEGRMVPDGSNLRRPITGINKRVRSGKKSKALF